MILSRVGLYTKPPPGVQINWLHPITNQLEWLWLLNEGSGNRVFDKIKGNTGSFVNAPLWLPNKAGLAITSNGSSSYVSAAKAFAAFDDITFSFLFSTTSAATVKTLFGWVSTGTTDGGWVELNTNESGAAAANKTFWSIRDEAAAVRRVAMTNAVLYNGEPHWLSVTRAGTVSLMYMDGRSQSLTTGSGSGPVGTITPSHAVFVGARNLRGTADEFSVVTVNIAMMHRRVLGPQEIRELHSHPYDLLLSQSPSVKYFLPVGAQDNPRTPLVGAGVLAVAASRMDLGVLTQTEV